MAKANYKVREKVRLYPGMAGWHFVYVGKKQSEEIKKKYGKSGRGFGSIPVQVTIGNTSWKTSIFPSKDEPYLLPLKASVRKREGIAEGDTITFTVTIL
jgi:hypothetical protein